MQRDTLCHLMCGWLAWPMLRPNKNPCPPPTKNGPRILTTADELRYVGTQDAAEVVADEDGFRWRVPKGWLVPINL